MEGNYKKWINRINAKLDKGEYTGNAQDLKDEIDSKANISHTHDISSITDLQTALDGKLNIPTMTNNYYGLWDNTNKRFVDGNINKVYASYGNAVTIGGNNQGHDKFQVGRIYNDEQTLTFPDGAYFGVGYDDTFNGDYNILMGTSGNTPDFNSMAYSYLVNGYGYPIWRASIFSYDKTGELSDAYGDIMLRLNYGNPQPIIEFDVIASEMVFKESPNNASKLLEYKYLNNYWQFYKPIKGGNIKDGLRFTLPTSITPQPNMLIPKTDGSGLLWYENSSVGAEIPSYSSPTSGYVARWDGAKFVNGSIQDNGINIGVGTTSDTNTLPARVKINPNNQKYFNLPLVSTSSLPTTVSSGDIISAYNRLWLGTPVGEIREYSNYAKLQGFTYDKRVESPFHIAWNFDTIHTQNPKYSDSLLINTGRYYGAKIIDDAPTAVGVHPDMYEGWLWSIQAGSTVGIQYFIDALGQLFIRGYGGQYHVKTSWGKAVLERQNQTTQLSEKINATKGVVTKDLSFTLQASITPTPNTLVPKTDGSRPTWYNNSSVAKDIALLEDINSANITNAINSATAAQKTTMRTALLGTSTPASPTISGANPSIIAKGVDTYIDLYGLNLTLLDPSYIYIKRADESRINALQFYNLTTNSVRTLWNLPTDLPDGVYQIYIQNGVTVQGASQGYLYVTNQQLTQVDILQNQWIKRLNPQADGSPAVQNGNGNIYNIALDNYVRLYNTSHNGVNGRSSWKSPNILPTAFTDVWSVEGSMLYSGAGSGGGTIIPFIGVTKTTDAEFLVPSDINILENTFTQLWAEGMRYGFTGGNLIYASTTIPLKIVIEKPVGDKIYMKVIYDTGSTVTIVYQNAVPITPDSNYAIFMNLQPSTYGNMWWSCQFTVKKLI